MGCSQLLAAGPQRFLRVNAGKRDTQRRHKRLRNVVSVVRAPQKTANLHAWATPYSELSCQVEPLHLLFALIRLVCSTFTLSCIRVPLLSLIKLHLPASGQTRNILGDLAEIHQADSLLRPYAVLTCGKRLAYIYVCEHQAYCFLALPKASATY